MIAVFSLSQPEPEDGELSEQGRGERRKEIRNPCSIRELIDEVYLPNAIIMGVGYNVFWELTPRRLRPFLKAYEEKVEERSRKEAEAFGAYAVVFNKDFRERSDG